VARLKEDNVAKYKVNIGIDTPSARIEAGAVVEHTSLPSKSIKWLVDQGIVEPVNAKDTAPVVEPKPKPVVEDEVEEVEE
jgi:hypothetical protein